MTRQSTSGSGGAGLWSRIPRRAVLKVGGALAAVTALRDDLARALTGRGYATPSTTGEVALTVNGTVHRRTLEARVTLLDALREDLALTGTKKGCDRGACGACTVLVDDRRIKSCTTLAVMQDGARITTVEGLAEGDQLHPVQEAFLRHDGYQCGFCTPGQVMSAVALIEEGHAGSDDEVREWMSGNLCRCAAYPGIVAAVRDAAGPRA